MRSSPVIGYLAVAVVAAASSEAAAEDAAQAFIDQANEHRRRGEHESALGTLRRAQDLGPSPKITAQMGLVLHDLERWIEAETSLVEALASKDPWVRKNRTPLKETLKTVRSHIGEVAVRGPPGAKTFVGGKQVGVLPLAEPVRVGEGKVTVEVHADGFRPVRETVLVRGRESTSIEPRLVSASLSEVRVPPPQFGTNKIVLSPAKPEQSDPRDKSSRLKWTGVGLVAVGVASMATGVVFLVLDGKGTCAMVRCPRLYDTAVSGWIALGAGTVAGTAGGYVLFRSSRLSVAASPWGIAGRF